MICLQADKGNSRSIPFILQNPVLRKSASEPCRVLRHCPGAPECLPVDARRDSLELRLTLADHYWLLRFRLHEFSLVVFHLAPGFARLIGREHPASPVVEGHFPDQSDRRSFVRLEGEGCTLVLEDRTHKW